MIYGLSEVNSTFTKGLFITIGGLITSVLAFFQPMYVYVAICLFAKTIDVAFALRLSMRVKVKTKKSDGKFRSKEMNKMFLSLFCFGTMMMLFFLIDKFIIITDGLFLTRFACGAFVFQQIWSCLESESSSNDSKWATVMQRIMVDKTERHFNVDLKEYKEHDK